MLYSMTGFGGSKCEAKGISFLVEIKTLNNRFLKTIVKLPDALAFTEPEVQRIIREELCRGSITYVLHMRNASKEGPYEVNHAAVQNYMRHLEQILTLHSGEGHQIDLAAILQLPGVCEPRRYGEEENEFFLDIVKKLTRQALKRLRQMRADEGKSIVADLQNNCRIIQDNLDTLAKTTDSSVDQYRKRIEKRVNEMLSGMNLKLDEDILAKEVAMFAERSDINEEISRLHSHLEQFTNMCEESQDQAGRRLEFLTQEMLREANTIGSKANNTDISHHVVEIKVAIDRLKEQVLNVE